MIELERTLAGREKNEIQSLHSRGMSPSIQVSMSTNERNQWPSYAFEAPVACARGHMVQEPGGLDTRRSADCLLCLS